MKFITFGSWRQLILIEDVEFMCFKLLDNWKLWCRSTVLDRKSNRPRKRSDQRNLLRKDKRASHLNPRNLNQVTNLTLLSFRNTLRNRCWFMEGSLIFEFGLSWIMMVLVTSSKKVTSEPQARHITWMRKILMIKKFILRIMLSRRIWKITGSSKMAIRSVFPSLLKW